MTVSHDAPEEPLARSLLSSELPDERRSLELLADAQGGDRSALQELLSRYQERLLRIVRIQLGGASLRRECDSMDIVQSTFKAALPKIGELRPSSAASLLRWLALIATNQIRDAYDRRHALKREAARVEPLDTGSSRVDERQLRAPSVASPERAAMLEEIRELLDANVASLPDDQRRVVVLRDYCGESWERISAELERENGAARQLHQRAWIHLRRALRPALEGRPSPTDGKL